MRSLPLAAAPLAAIMVVTGCGVHRPVRSAAESGTQASVAGVMDLIASRAGVVGIEAPGRTAHFALTSDGGRTFSRFGPVTGDQAIPDSVFFLGRSHAWLATFPGGGGSDTVYRTTNGGRSWQSFSAPDHVIAAGSTDALQFVSPASGWLADIEPTGPGEELLHTANGGATWQCVASIQWRPGSGCPGVLPVLGRVMFEPAGQIGWLGGGMFSTALYRTSDGGRSWQRMRIIAPPNAIFGLPTAVGTTVIETATAAAGSSYSLLTFVSRDNGGHWAAEPALRQAGSGAGCQGPMSVSFPSESSGWAAAFRDGRVVIYRSSRLRAWRLVAELARQPGGGSSCAWPQIQAADSTSAWVDIPGGAGAGDAIYSTDDGGRSWARIDRAAVAAYR